MHERSQPAEPDPEKVAELAQQFGINPKNVPKTPTELALELERARAADQLVGLVNLRRPFPDDEIELLPRYAGSAPRGSRKKGRCGFCDGYHELPAVHLSYVGHASATARLLTVDDFWSWEPVAYDSLGLPLMDLDKEGNPVGFWIRLTVCGMSRLGYGSCDPGAREAVKELIGDAIRNALMRFGGALELWKKGDRDVGYVDETGQVKGGARVKPEPERVEQDASGDPVFLVCVSCGESTPKQQGKIMAAKMDTPKWDVHKGDPIYRCGACGQFVPVPKVERQTDDLSQEPPDDLPFR